MTSKTKQGKDFEKQVEDSFVSTPYFFYRLKDAAKWLRGGSSSFTPRNIADAITYKTPFLYIFELKSTNGSSISFNANVPWEKPKNENSKVMIKHTQVKDLMKAAKKDGVLPCLILNYRPRELKSGTTENRAFLIHISEFVNFAVNNDKSSISIEDCEQVGIEIAYQRLKSNYKYNVTKMIKEAEIRYINKGYINKGIIDELKSWCEKIGSELG